MAFVSGALTTFSDDGNKIILDLKDGLDFLNQRNDGVGLLKRIGTNGFTFANHKHEWTETALAVRYESITLADGSTTALDVVDAYQYQVNELLKCENEVMRVTAIADSNTLTVTRGYAGTTGAAHSDKRMYSLGSADPENSTAPAGIADNASRLYNYDQTLTRAIELSNDEIAQLNTEGNSFPKQLERRFIEIHRQLLQAVLYGVRHQDTTNKIYAMGGLKQFVTTNVTNVGGAVTIANIDAKILDVVLAGGDPKVLGVSPYQKQKLDALDANLVRTGKKKALSGENNVGGNPMIQTWQSGVLDHEIEIFVDPTILPDELWILDTDHIEIGHKSHNGIVGNFHVEDATTPGQDGKKRVIRGKYSTRIGTEKAHALLYGLS